MKKRPFGITLLAIFSLLAALAAIWYALQLLLVAPKFLGGVGFFGIDWFGALMWGIMVLIYLWVFRMLWNVDPQGWLFITVLSALNLILAFVSVLGQSTISAMGPAIVINGLILIYALLPGTKAAFNIPVKAK